MLAGYCIRRGDDPPPGELAGLSGRPVRALAAGGLAVWVSDAVPAPADAAALRAHDAVVMAALRTATPLPLRFGTLFDDEEAARAALTARADELAATLARVSGRIEMGVRVMWPAPNADQEPPRARSGTEYLAARRTELLGQERRLREADALLDVIDACFAILDAPTARSVLPAPEIAGTLAHLVHRSDLHRYRQCAEKARQASPASATLRFSGPWAPYSFV